MSKAVVKGFRERLRDGEYVLQAEGYLFMFERRGYLKAGSFVPEVVIEHPDLLKAAYEEMVHAGSDVVLAFTYYAHREKMAMIGREDELEKINRTALRLARQVADNTGTLMAGNICNTNLYTPNVTEEEKMTMRNIFKEQIIWAVEEGADYIVGETFFVYEESIIALEEIKKHGNGLPCVMMLALGGDWFNTPNRSMDDLRNAFKALEAGGADVVGLNCCRGPMGMLPYIRECRKACKVPIAALPITWRTGKDQTYFSFVDEKTGEKAFPDLDAYLCSRAEIAEFTKECMQIGVQVLGICCGNSAGHTRAMAETLGRKPPASHYSADLSQHFCMGDPEKYARLKSHNVNVLQKQI